MSDHPADIHDGQDPEPADEPATIEPGHIVELAGPHSFIPAGTRATVVATTDRSAVIRVVVPMTIEVPLSDLRRCD